MPPTLKNGLLNTIVAKIKQQNHFVINHQYMRPRFEKDLSSFSTLAKEEQEGFELPEDIKRFEQVLDWHLNQAAKRQGTRIGDQRKIYDMQKKKQDIMSRLKNWLSCIDNPECEFEKEGDSRDAFYDSEKERFIYILNDHQAEATFGEIITDIDWDILYSLDKDTVPRNLIKKYLVERTKSDLRQLLDQQIIISEAKGNVASPRRKRAYLRYEGSMKSSMTKNIPGFISETIVKSILKKLVYDSDADFKIVESDIFEDVEHKVDFIIHFTNKNRGVEITPENRKNIGIQFTINTNAINKKLYQVRKARWHITPDWHIDDLVLVAFPLNISTALVRKWKEAGCPAGGPDKYLDRHVAKGLFKTLMKDTTSSDRADEYWDKIKDRFSKNNSKKL